MAAEAAHLRQEARNRPVLRQGRAGPSAGRIISAESISAAFMAMAEASLAHGYQYIRITDHSKTAHYAGGLTIEEIEEQQAEIDRDYAGAGQLWRKRTGLRVRARPRSHPQG
jgi:hypothetical protein